MKFPPKIKHGVKLIALIIGMIADGIMLFVCFTAQAVDLPSRIAFAAIGITIIFLIPVTYEDKARKLWLCLVIVAVFYDTSYLLAITDAKKTVATIDNDQELGRLTAEKNQADNTEKSFRDAYIKALSDPTVTAKTQADISAQLNDAKKASELAESKRSDRYKEVSSGSVMSSVITAEVIFLAIPKGIADGHIAQVIMNSLIAIIIQGMIVFSLSDGQLNRQGIKQFWQSLKTTKPKRGRPFGAVTKNRKPKQPVIKLPEDLAGSRLS